MQYFTTCYACKRLQEIATDDYGNLLEGIGHVAEFEIPDHEQVDGNELCSCNRDW